MQIFLAATKESQVLTLAAHIYQLLLPTSIKLMKRVQPSVKAVNVWTGEATSALPDCFECTNWKMFRDAATQDNDISLEEDTSCT